MIGVWFGIDSIENDATRDRRSMRLISLLYRSYAYLHRCGWL